MNIKSILSKYPELDGKLIDTIDENMKLFISNEDYKLYVMLNTNKSFVLKEQNDTKSFENLSDVNEYISNKYPLKKGDICEDMNWLGNKIKIVATNNKVFVYADENGRYGIAYSALHVGRNSLYNDISLGQELKIAREDFGLADDEFLYSDENKIYSITESNPDYVILHNLTDKNYSFVKKGDLQFDYDNIVHLTVSKKFENLQDAQGYAWSNYDMNFNESLKQLQNKIKREYQDIMDKLEKTNAREILKHIKQIYSLKMVRDVFDNEVGIFMPKATVDYLLKEDVNAADELADRVSEYDSADFHNENVQTAVEDIQIEKEKEFESINTYEPELEL